MKTSIVVPVKNPRQAKQRLSPVLSPDERYHLDLAMIGRVMRVLAGFMIPSPQPSPQRGEGVNFKSFASSIPTVLIFTDSDEVVALARRHPFEVVKEADARGQTEAITAATRWSVANGFERQITMPGDLPYVTAEDIQALLDADIDAPGVIFCPATGDDGTNAIVTTPPDALTWRFGARSFPDYVDQARRKGLQHRILRLPNFVLDIDTPDDLKTFLLDPRGHEAAGLLAAWNVPERLSVEAVRA